MTRAAEKAARRGGRERRETEYDRTIRDLRKTKIGPLFPAGEPGSRGMRGVSRKATKRPFALVKPRKPRRMIMLECRVGGCLWTTNAMAWRPARALRDAHQAKAHR